MSMVPRAGFSGYHCFDLGGNSSVVRNLRLFFLVLLFGTKSGSPSGSGSVALVGVSDSEYLTFMSSSSEGATSPSSSVSLESELSFFPSIFSLSPDKEDLSLSIASLLSSVLGQFEFAPLGVLATGEAELVLLFVFMKSLRSFPRPTLAAILTDLWLLIVQN